MAAANNYDLSDLGGVPVSSMPQAQASSSSYDLSDLGAVPVPTNANSSPSWLDSLKNEAWETAQNIGAGGLDLRRDIMNLPHNLIAPFSQNVASNFYYDPTTNAQMSASVGLSNPSVTDQIAQGMASYLPFGAVGDAALAEKGATEALPLSAKLANLAGQGAAYGLVTSQQNPYLGAAQDATGNVASYPIAAAAGKLLIGSLHGLGMLANKVSSQNWIKNLALDYLNQKAPVAGALTPAETAENVASNYTLSNGQQLPVDIGTATNNPMLKGVYHALQYVPTSGVSDNLNMVARGLSDNALNKNALDVQSVLDEGLLKNADLNARSVTAQTPPEVPKLQTQLAALSKNSDDLAAQQEGLIANYGNVNQNINNAPAYLSELSAAVPDKASITSYLKNSVSNAFEKAKSYAASLYEPLNNSNLNLSDLSGGSLPETTNVVTQLMAQRDNLNNIFGSDSDLGKQLNSELDKVSNMVTPGVSSNLTLPNVIQRIQNIGKLGAAATSQGNRYEGMLLSNLQNALSGDVDNVLRQSGNGAIADQLKTATSNYKTNVVPFWRNTEIRKAVTDKNYIPQGAKLAKALHDSNNATVLNAIEPSAKNASLYQLITGGKGTSAGESILTPESLAATYGRLPVDAKQAISSYNPVADKYFESLPQLLAGRDNLERQITMVGRQASQNSAAQKSISSQLNRAIANKNATLSRIDSATQSAQQQQAQRLQQLAKQFQDLKDERYGLDKEGSKSTEVMKKLAASGGVVGGLTALHSLNPLTTPLALAGGIIGKNIAPLLRSPDLIDAYIRGTKFPVNAMLPNILDQLIRGSTQSMAAPIAGVSQQ